MATEVLPSVRASNDDRERVAAVLADATGEGLLTIEEADDRLARVYAARYLDDLTPITADLPAGHQPPPRVDVAARSAARTRFVWHLAVYLVGVAGVLAVWAATGAGFFWPAWPIIGVGIGVLSHARAAGRAGDAAGPEDTDQPAPRRSHGCGGWAYARPRSRSAAAGTAAPAAGPPAGSATGPATAPADSPADSAAGNQSSRRESVPAGGDDRNPSIRHQVAWTSLSY